jgi:predicted MFS family arabinose efflux permease
MAFTVVGARSLVNYTVCLILGGVFSGTAGWRVVFYLVAGLNAILFSAAVWGLLHNRRSPFLEVI